MLLIEFIKKPRLIITSIKRRLGQQKVSQKHYEVFSKLNPGDIAIDCGANVGLVTEKLAAAGARVYAFEPDPNAFKVLRKRFANQSNVKCFQLAVGARSDKQRLYLHKQAKEDPIKWSVGSSFLKFKGNIDMQNSLEVKVVDLAWFIKNLGQRVSFLKIDIEGMEYELLESLIDTGAIGLVDDVYVETHEQRIPELRSEHKQLKKKLHKDKINNLHLNWI